MFLPLNWRLDRHHSLIRWETETRKSYLKMGRERLHWNTLWRGGDCHLKARQSRVTPGCPTRSLPMQSLHARSPYVAASILPELLPSSLSLINSGALSTCPDAPHPCSQQCKNCSSRRYDAREKIIWNWTKTRLLKKAWHNLAPVTCTVLCLKYGGRTFCCCFTHVWVEVEL
jgi:hypothetical protein